MSVPACPSFEMLSAFADQELTPAEAQAIQMHIATCDRCREELLDWIDTEEHCAAPDCLDPEVLVAYSDGVLTDVEHTRATAHLASCWRCRREVEAMRPVAEATPISPAAARPRRAWRARRAADLAGFARTLVRPGPLLSAVTAAALVIIALTQLMPKSELARVDVVSRAPERTADVELQRRTAAPQVVAILPKDKREADETRARSESEQASGQAMAPPAVPAPAAAPPVAKKAQPRADTGQAEAKLGRLPNAQPRFNRALTDEPSVAANRGFGGTVDSPREQRLAPAQGEARQPTADVNTNTTNTPAVLVGHGAPADDSPIVFRFGPSELQSRLDERNGWTLVELTEHRHAWVRSADLDAMLPPRRPLGVMNAIE